MIFTPQVLIGLLAGAHFNLYVFDVTSLGIELCGGIALARYVRAYADSRTLPILGVLVFIAGGVATSRLQHVPQIASYGLLPVQLLALRAVCLSPTMLRTVLLILVFTVAVLNPNQVVFLSAVALLPFAGWHVYRSAHRARALLALGVGCFAVILAALPVLYGILSMQNGTWPPTDATQDFLYIGVIPTVVVLSSLVFFRRVPVITVLCWASLLVWFVFAMGMNTPLYPFLFEHVPGFSAFRRPADGAYLMNLVLALLIGSSAKFDRTRLGSRARLAIICTFLAVFLGVLCWYAMLSEWATCPISSSCCMHLRGGWRPWFLSVWSS